MELTFQRLSEVKLLYDWMFTVHQFVLAPSPLSHLKREGADSRNNSADITTVLGKYRQKINTYMYTDVVRLGCHSQTAWN
jgi:hypothetical protein